MGRLKEHYFEEIVSMETFDDISCEEMYPEYSDTFFMSQLLEEAELAGVNLELQMIAEELREDQLLEVDYE